MKIPPLLLGIALLFWGWQTGLLPLAILLAILLESNRLFTRRWEVNRNDWSKIADLCAIILLSILAISLLQEEKQTVYALGKQLPVIFFPLILVQRFSLSGKTDIVALSLIERKNKIPSARYPPADLSVVYLIATLLAAGIENNASVTYYPGICLIGIWAVYAIRSLHFSRVLWTVLILLVVTIGHFMHIGLHATEEAIYEYSMQMFDRDANPLKTTTAIGDIGRQKLYNNILFRVLSEKKPYGNLLLREATYNSFNSRRWYALKSPMIKAEPAERHTWEFQPGITAPYAIRIRTKPRNGQGLLKQPYGTVKIERLSAEKLQTNSLGTVSFSDAPAELTDYRILFDPEHPRESSPTPLDLKIPKQEVKAIELFIDQLQLRGKTPQEIVTELKHHFDEEFSYTLDHKGKEKQSTALANFLLDRKAGHCELFASATVLILRACDIPARYAVGYVAAEYSPIERQYIIRQRHGHAWTLVYLDGKWHNLDTTSGNWLEIEEQNQSPLRIIADIGSFIKFQFARLRASDENHLGKAAAGLILLLILLVVKRLKMQKRMKKAKVKTNKKTIKIEQSGLDSGFYHLETLLTKKGHPRNPGEPLLDWSTRIQLAAPDLLNFQSLENLIHQHYSLRFSKTSSRENLEELIRALEKQITTERKIPNVQKQSLSSHHS